MEFRLLGAFEVWDGGQPVEIVGQKRRALLALLVLRANEVVRSELLVDELWGERPPRNAAAALRTHVSRLRKTLGPDTIASREWGYVLRAAPTEIDLRRFEGLVADAEQLAAGERATTLAEALALWRGPPLADLVNEPALQRDIPRLEELRLSTLERRIDADLEMGRNADLVGELEALVAEQPLREHLRWLLILALYRAGRQAEALEVYRETRRVLIEELGLEPSPALKELEQAILRQDPSLDANASPTPRVPPAVPPPTKRNRVLPVALLALLALGLAGAATAIAVVHRQRSATSGTTTEAIFETVPKAAARPATTSHETATAKNQTTAPATQTTATTSTKPAPPTRHTTPLARRPQKRHKPRAPSQKPVTIADNFAGDQIDGTIWQPTSFGTGWTMAERGGHLEFNFTPNTAGDSAKGSYGGLVGTLCKFPGDFDARVRFALAQWPAGNGITVELAAFLGQRQNGWAIARRSAAQWGEQYTSYTGAATSIQLDDLSGALRIARRHGVVTAYFLHNGRWDTLTSGRNTGLAVIGVSAIGGPGYNIGPFGGQQVVVDFDHFSVGGTNPTCPPGAETSH